MWVAPLVTFVRRRFRPSSQRWLDAFDAVFGILTPIVCLLIDPQV